MPGISLFSCSRKRFLRQIPSAEQKGTAQCGKDRKKQTDLRHFRLLETFYCHIPGQKRRTDIVTEREKIFSFSRRNFSLISQVRAGFCPYRKATEKSTDYRKEAFSEAKKRLQNRRKDLIDQGNATCADHKTGYKKKRKEHRKHPAGTRAAVRLRHLWQRFPGKKASEGKVRSEKTPTAFWFSSCIPAVFFCNSL